LKELIKHKPDIERALNLGKALSGIKREILEYLSKNPSSQTKDISKNISVGGSDKVKNVTTSKRIAELKSLGLVENKGSANKSSWSLREGIFERIWEWLSKVP